jgi:hypothetical protein
MPGTRDVGANIRELNASKTKRPQAQKVAIALSEARKAGAAIPPPKAPALSRAGALRKAYTK